MTRAHLGPGERERYKHELFLHELDASFEDTDVASALVEAKLTREFVRESCLREEGALRTPIEAELDEADAALVRLAEARTQRSTPMVLVHGLVFVPGLARLVVSLAFIACTVAFMIATPGAHGADEPARILLWAAQGCAVAAAAVAVMQLTGLQSVRLFLIQAVLLGAAPVWLSVSTLAVTTVPKAPPASAALTLSLAGTFAVLVCTEVFRPRPDVEGDLFVERVRGLSAGAVARLTILLVIAVPMVVLLLALGTGAKPRRLDMPRPDEFVLIAAVAVLGVVAVLSLAGRRAIRLSAARQTLGVAEQRARSALRYAALLPYIRAMVDSARPSYREVLMVSRPAGLSQAFDPIYEVPTAALERVRTTLAAMPGGSLGIAGPRGVGKSTLIASICGHAAGDSRNALRVNVSAPVEYAPRDFLLHLYARVCRAAIERAGGHWSVPDPLSGAGSRRARNGLWALALIFLCAAGTLLILAASGRSLTTSALAAVLLLLLATGLGIQGAVRHPLTSGPDERVPRPLHELALDRLHEIEYQQSISGEWSGGVKMLPVGIDATLKQGHGFVRQPKSLPDIVDSLRDFLRMAAASSVAGDQGRRDPVIVGIDELDKIEGDDRARQFLSDIKSVFGVPGCQFLVSVSEDAMASFERRGLPFRDVFDSAFDEIVRLQYLTFEEGSDLLGRRTTEFPVPFKGLCFCLSGGLPRDLIRAARSLVEYAAKGEAELAASARHLVGRDLAGKAAAVSTAIRKVDAEPATSAMIVWCNRIADSATTTSELEDAMRALGRIDLRWADATEETELAALRRLAREITGYTYYANTLMEFFRPAGESRWREALKPDRRGFDVLAQARRALTSNPLVGWASVTEFRRAWNMPAVEVPRTLVGRPSLAATTRALAHRIRP